MCVDFDDAQHSLNYYYKSFVNWSHDTYDKSWDLKQIMQQTPFALKSQLQDKTQTGLNQA